MDREQLRARLAAEKSLSLQVRVIPRSRKTAWAGMRSDGARKLTLAAAPEKGKANEELIRFLAAEFQVGCAQVEIVTGATSQTKLVRIRL